MRFHLGSAVAVLVVAGVMAGSNADAAEIGLLEMLFGARPSAPQIQQTPDYGGAGHGERAASQVVRRRPSIRYAALPVKVRVKEHDISERQQPIDMKSGAAAAFLKDETLRPGDIVVLETGARVFSGSSDKRHAMRDFVPIQSSAYLSRSMRKQVAGLFTPVGLRPSDEARRVVAQTIRPAADPAAEPARTTAMRVISPWRTGP